MFRNSTDQPANSLMNAVEALSNIFYLIQQSVNSPQNLNVCLELEKPIMADLKTRALEELSKPG